MTLKQLADKLDAAPWIVADWRRFLRWWSVRFSAIGFMIALGNAATLAGGVMPFYFVLPHIVVDVIAAAVFLAVMVSRVWKQPQ